MISFAVNDEGFPALTVAVLHDGLLQVSFLSLRIGGAFLVVGAGGDFFDLFVFFATGSLLFVDFRWVVFVVDFATKVFVWVVSARVSDVVLVGLDSAVTNTFFSEGGVLDELPVDFAVDDILQDDEVLGFLAGTDGESEITLDDFIPEDNSVIEAPSLAAVEASMTAFVSVGVDRETFSVPAGGDVTNDDAFSETTCINFEAEFPTFAVGVLFDTEALPASVEINSAGFGSFFPEAGVLSPAVGFFDDDDERREVAFFTFGTGGAFFAVFDFLATGALRSVDEGDLPFLFGFAHGESPGIETAGLAPASFAADDFFVFTIFVADGKPLAVPVFDAFDPCTFFVVVTTSVFFLFDDDPAAPLAYLESGTPKYAVKGRCCKDIL